MKNNFWKKTLVDQDKSILETINSMESHGQQISLIINNKRKIVGTLSDGDLRRAVLNDVNLSDPVKKIMNKKPILLKNSFDKKKILSLMNYFKITRIPLVNEKKKIIDLIKWEEIFKETHENLLVIMSGGKGSRMMPLTKKTPKTLLKIKGKPILLHLLEKAENEGFKDVFISINHLGSKIKNFLKKDSIKNKLNISFLEEKKALGTAGSLKLMKRKVKKPIIIINGDILTELKFRDLIQFHKENKSDATMAVKMVFNEMQFGVVKNIQSKIVNLE